MASGMRTYYPRARTSSGSSITGTARSRTRRPESPAPTLSPDPPDSTFPEIENFDPTYGLRPEGLPTKSVFRSFGRLFANPSRGLADLAEESADEDDTDVIEEGTSYDEIDWEDTVPVYTPEPSVLGDHQAGTNSGIEYETVPAVGGGTVTRPRVFHAHSQVHPGIFRSARLSSPSRLTHAALERLPRADFPHRPHSLHNPYLPPFGVANAPVRSPSIHTYPHHRDPFEVPTPPLYHSPPHRAVSPSPSSPTHESSSHTQTHSVPTPPSTEALPPVPRERARRTSITSMSASGDTDPRIVLRPALHGALSTLATLAHSNHTLSPYTRAPSHFTVRSGPRGAPPAPPRAPPRARRRRTYVLGTAAAEAQTGEGPRTDEEGGESISPPSEFDAEDMDRYFRIRSEVSVVAGSEPEEPGPPSLEYAARRRGHRQPQVHARHARPPENMDSYSLRRHGYSYHE